MEIDERGTASSITVTPYDGGSLVTLVGEVDASLRDQAGLAMAEVLSRGGRVVVDLAGVTFIDSSGLAFVIQLHRLGVEDGEPCVLRDAPLLVRDLLEMVGLLGEMTFETTQPEGDAPVGDREPTPV